MSAIALRGPERVVIHQHRRALWSAGFLALVGGAVVVAAWLWASSASDTFAGSGCSVENTVRGCGDTVRAFLDTELRFSRAVDYAGLAMMILPACVGMFVAGPLIGRELESGTYITSWSQSVSPARWLAARLAVPAVLTLAGVSVLSAFSAWAWSRAEGTYYPRGDWYEREVYGAMGSVPVGYALCMLALGALAGLLLRRTVAAMAVTVLAYVPLVMVLNRVREDLWPTARFLGGDRPGGDAWLVDSGMLTASGKAIHPKDCSGGAGDTTACLRGRGGVTAFADHHPASHFWPLQLVETGILLVLAALAVALAFRVLRRRHG
ncbi:ABC transporter permease [Streptomyces sp. NPDC086796]|uniref:ABC transporter permease n=1 Tax=unclassified Streptomyces TaxID=2593676 RepID=UPI00380834F0